jgi:hypothetical protein
LIFRPVFVRVSSYLKGSGPDNVMVMALGGTVGQDSAMLIDERANFSVGDEVILYLNNEGIDPDLTIDGYSPWFVLGRYKIDGSEVTDGLQVMPLQVLLDEIADAQR